MKIINEIKSFFYIDSLLEAELDRSKNNYNSMNQHLDKLKRVSEILKDHCTEDVYDEETQPWVYLKKNCFVDSILEILNGKEAKN